MCFLDAFMDMKDEYIYLPHNVAALKHTMNSYESVGLPGACGSIDVVHIKWSACPAGDHNRAKGKEGYPTVAFQCITDYNRRFLGIFGPQFGTRNDQEIVKLDPNVMKIRSTWFSRIFWSYYTETGAIRQEKGVYLICDNGYLRWPELICPYGAGEPVHTEAGFFSSNIESVRKDVECTFGIIKKRWRILNNGFYYRDIVTCEKIFVTCCCLHNFLLDLMERVDVRIGRGRPLHGDFIWLDVDHTLQNNNSNLNDQNLAFKFGNRRVLLSKHLRYIRNKGN